MENQMNQDYKFCHSKIFSVVKVLLAIAIIVWISALTRNSLRQYDYIGKSPEAKNAVTIFGTGKVVTVPDVATVSLGLKTTDMNIAIAQEENTISMNKLLDALEKFGIDKKDVKTTYYQVYPEYEWIKDRGDVLKGYVVSQSVTVKLRDFTKISAVLGKVGELGLNQVGGLNFTVDEPEKYKTEAREKALKNAKEKVTALAKSAGMKLGRIIGYREVEPSPYLYRGYEDIKALGIGGAAAPAPEIEAGSSEITVNVELDWEIL